MAITTEAVRPRPTPDCIRVIEGREWSLTGTGSNQGCADFTSAGKAARWIAQKSITEGGAWTVVACRVIEMGQVAVLAPD